MTSVRVRAARPDEAPLLTELGMRSKAYWGYDAGFMAAVRDEMTVHPHECDGERLRLAERDGTVLGYYLLGGAPPAGSLESLFADPSAIGTGLGRVLLDDARATAHGLGFRVLTLDADPGAEGFYLHCGARPVGRSPSGSVPGRTLPRLELDV